MFRVHRTYELTTGVKNNTIAVFNDRKSIKVLYHKTIVIDANAKKVTIRNGGWDTTSTRLVINRGLEKLMLSHWYLEHSKGITYLRNSKSGFKCIFNNEESFKI